MKRTLLIVGAVVLLGATIAVAWRVHRARRIERAGGVPAMPATLADGAAELRERVAAATSQAHAGSVAALGELSRLYHVNGFLPEALACYAGLEQLEAGEPRWWHRDASIRAGYGDTDAALARAERAVQLAPDYVSARLRLGDLRLKRNELVRAAATYEDVLRRGDHPHAQLGLARIDVETGRWPEAATRLERLVAQTNHQLGYDLIVTVYERLGRHAEAAALRGRAKAAGAYRDPPDPWLDELLELCYDPYRLALVAGTAQRGGDLAAALRWLGRAVELAPDDVTMRFQLAGVHLERRDAARAREELTRCTAMTPTFPDAWAHLAALLEQGGDASGAERVVAAGLGHCPDSPGLHLMRARGERRAGRLDTAIAAYRRSIELRANEAEPYVELATLLLQKGRADEGVALLTRALEAEPDHPTALSLLVLTAVSARDEPGARRWLARVQSQPRVPAAQREKLLAAFREQFGRE